MPADVRASKRLAYVLRHRPGSVGLTLDDNGWVGVDALLVALAASGPAIGRADLERIVRINDKQRFELDPATDRIRARQGHSLDVDLGLGPADPPAVLFHGTPVRNLAAILASGIERRGRHHVHLSPDVGTAQRVGRRRGDAVVLEVDAAAMAHDGVPFWLTGNGVWLTDHVPPTYLSVRG